MRKIDALYIHFPFCRHLCNYCDFYKHKLSEEDQVDKFEVLLKKQIEEHKTLLSKYHFQMETLKSLYIGGGTPSLWSKRGSLFLQEYLLGNIKFEKDYEFTIEIDPGTWTKKEIESWISIGVNRFSIGVQSFNNNYLAILDREHKRGEVIETLDYLKSIDANYSIDLMLGLPKLATRRLIIEELKELIAYDPSHFSVYILKCRKNYPHLSLLPSEDEVADEYLGVCQFLNGEGFKQYEVSNFAKVGRESVHNKKYWKYESVAAIGPNSAGLLVIDDNTSLRYKWKTQSIKFETEKLIGTPFMIEKLYMQLRAKGCFNKNSLGENNRKAFTRIQSLWENRGYISSNEDIFELSAEGYLMLDSLMDDIFNELSI